MTRILALTNLYPPWSLGGDRSAADVLERLAGRGHEVTVLTSDWRDPTVPDDFRPAADVIRSLRLYWNDHRVVVPPRRERARMEWHNRRALDAALAWARPEVVCVWTMGALSMGVLHRLADTGLPLVYAVCNDWLVWGPDQDAWVTGWSDRPRMGRVASALTGLPTTLPDIGSSGTFLFVSDWTRRYAEEHSRWTYPDSAVVYSGYEAEEFGPTGPDGARSTASWRGRLLYIGRLDPDKAPVTAVEALALLPAGTTLDVVGPGHVEERLALQTRAEELGLSARVRFDQRPRSELAALYRDADVLVFPSRWQEPFGLTPLEAMACGTPVVSTCLGGSAEYLRDGYNCLCVPAGDPPALARAVSALAADPSRRAGLVEAGHRTAAQLTSRALADCFEAWLTAAAARFASGRPPGRRLELS
ncbi:MAG: glycosyltransferase family 4 protein [Acidimicrobiales bacterium]